DHRRALFAARRREDRSRQQARARRAGRARLPARRRWCRVAARGCADGVVGAGPDADGGTVKSMRITLGDLVGSGSRAITRYTGTLLAVFVVQTLVMLATLLAMAAVLANVFAHLPIWDEAVDGDLVSLVLCIKWAHTNLLACASIGLG